MQCQPYRIKAAAAVVVVVVVVVQVPVAASVVLEVYFGSYMRCDLSSTLVSSPPFRLYSAGCRRLNTKTL
jgi:hypothetical protein